MEFLNCPITSLFDVACNSGRRERGSYNDVIQIKIMGFFCSNYVLYQQALLYVDVVIEIVQTVPGQNGNDDTGNYGNGTSKKNSLPFCPLNVKKALRMYNNIIILIPM